MITLRLLIKAEFDALRHRPNNGCEQLQREASKERNELSGGQRLVMLKC
jgi:hypothetical protein